MYCILYIVQCTSWKAPVFIITFTYRTEAEPTKANNICVTEKIFKVQICYIIKQKIYTFCRNAWIWRLGKRGRKCKSLEVLFLLRNHALCQSFLCTVQLHKRPAKICTRNRHMARNPTLLLHQCWQKWSYNLKLKKMAGLEIRFFISVFSFNFLW